MAEPNVEVRMLADGSILPPRAERLALFLADADCFEPGVDPARAGWTLIGGSRKGWSGADWKAITASPVFKLRVEDLMTEKEAALADPIWGRARWMIEQLYRESRATGDSTLMLKATEMRFRLAEKSAPYLGPSPSGRAEPESPAEDAQAPRGPGRPSAPSPANLDISGMTERLMKMGVKPPEAASAS